MNTIAKRDQNTKAMTINFHGTDLITVKDGDAVFVAMMPICKAVGVAWNAQLERIKRHPVLNSTIRIIRMVAADGKTRPFSCLPLDMLNGWLFSIDASRVKDGIREKLVRYQAECFKALSDYWVKGKAERPSKSELTTTMERTPLKDAVNMLVAKRGLPYPDAYKFIHHRFGVDHLDELTKEQLPQAIEYVHRLCMEGELLPKQAEVSAQGIMVAIPNNSSYSRWLVSVEDGKPTLIDASNKALIDVHVARQLANEAGAVAAYIESKAEQRDLEAKLLREESRRLRIFMGEENKSRLDKPISEIFMA
ncbi:phage antirepressor N-terminal domain-containing protein [Arsukibacterium indicum]|uniref:Phage antirepressor N-terminal domain-containing protein n=1 Tax=Arsukibacterium indicum TaxID=2848612 RepID=A0ABS6MH57_9GAMM|nr:phage antirepressor N-terminal domain-containing protein [Arsukibacterium indicum]MBV2128142.1 phage antirepressor N-terminal domain-containing protein [Arsukibacterium indicum]